MKPSADAPSWRALPGKEQSIFKHMMVREGHDSLLSAFLPTAWWCYFSPPSVESPPSRSTDLMNDCVESCEFLAQWLYEQKHNKKALKQADLILKKFPEHGETLSMKGLILSNMGNDKKQDAYDYAKRGLRADITNCVCWHVLGLLYRQDKDYAEASKCFVQTLRLDPNNYQAMRDLAHLQIHERNLQGFLETRRHILKARSRFIREWAAFAVANHLVGRLTIAQDILGEMENQFGESRDLDPFEKSEIMLYKATLLEEMGEYRKCYDFLAQREADILDETSLLEMQGRMSIFLRDYEKGRAAYKRLIESNKDNERYILGFMACDEDARIRELFALPSCSLNGAIGKADSMDFRKNLKQLQGGKIFQSTANAYVCLMPGSLRSSGEDGSGWLESCFTSQADRESRLQDPELHPVSGWKPWQTPKAPPSFRLVRIPPDEIQDAISKYFSGLRDTYAPFPVVDYLQLSFLFGDRFVSALDRFLRPQLRKGVVSLFSALRRLYTRNRAHLIGSVLESYVQHLEMSPSTFGPPLGLQSEKREDIASATEQQGEMATCLLYAYMLLAQHYDFTGRTEKALQTIQKAIDHTPTFADLYLVKGRIFKHAGAYHEACELHEKARNLDLADRYMNSKACSYMLRVNRTDEAKAVARLFTRQSETEDTPDTQCMWFELKLGKAFMRRAEYGDALTELHATLRHFEEIHEDQIDFHPYCLRKSTFRAYVSFLRMQDKVWSHRYFRDAGYAALEIYFSLHDGATMAMVLALARLSKLSVHVGRTNCELLPLLYHFSRKADIASFPEEMREMAASALTAAYGQPVCLSTESLRAAGDALMNELTKKCIEDPYDFVIRRRAFEALHFAGEQLTPDSPLCTFQSLPPCPERGSSEGPIPPEQTPTLADCEELLRKLQQLPGQAAACEKLKAACRDRFPLSEALKA
ncbi:N-terminal acetyltransferase complex subunit [Cyclospora cayetanensis]|uniref:N-terminal acetyltransferase complex subunit n=1 Tax=Cyclospora cayetanensis TaxID=88456 RepID=A0A1D3CZW2_9EIME|nr:N-terminal acetyltransferase complex subunit [Cyclospora cayetanensis]